MFQNILKGEVIKNFFLFKNKLSTKYLTTLSTFAHSTVDNFINIKLKKCGKV